MNFDPQQSVLSNPRRPRQRQQQQELEDGVSQRDDGIQPLSTVAIGVDDEGVGPPGSPPSAAAMVPSTTAGLRRGVGVMTANVEARQTGPLIGPAQGSGMVQCYGSRDRLYVDTSGVPDMPVPDVSEGLTTAGVNQLKEKVGVGTGFFDGIGPKRKRRHAEGTELDSGSQIIACGQSVDAYSGIPSAVNNPRSLLPRKGRAGLKKSTDTRKNNNRVALRDFTTGRRCVTDVVAITTPMVARLKVVSGISTEKVLRKNKKSILLDIGQKFGVLQLFIEGHPKPDEKVWVVTSKGLLPVLSTAVEKSMAQLTIAVRAFPVVARGRVRRDPQKQGTRPKAGEPVIDCYAIFVGEERRPLWVDSSLIAVEPGTVVSQQDDMFDQSQLQLQLQLQSMSTGGPAPVVPVSMSMPESQPEESPQPPRP